MEFRLNKIDTELRQIVNDSTKEGKVHSTKDSSKIGENKENLKERQERKKSKNQLLKYNTKEKLLVDAFKMKSIYVEASKDDTDLAQGRFLDIKK